MEVLLEKIIDAESDRVQAVNVTTLINESSRTVLSLLDSVREAQRQTIISVSKGEGIPTAFPIQLTKLHSAVEVLINSVSVFSEASQTLVNNLETLMNEIPFTEYEEEEIE
jgi:hypothetical protein